MKKIFLLITALFFCKCVQAQNKAISLAGNWQFTLDSANNGLKGKWFEHPDFKGNIQLPGTLDDSGIGQKPVTDTLSLNQNVMQRLWRKHRYVGPVWYKKKFVSGKGDFQLSLERVIWKTDCWIDGVYKGSQESLVGPQVFQLGALKAGQHTIVLRIDNSKQHETSIDNLAAAYTDDTQIIWNGILGKIVIEKQGATFLNDVQLYPDKQLANLDVSVGSRNQSHTIENIKARITIYNGHTAMLSKTEELRLDTGVNTSHISLNISKMSAWDEFHPHLYTVVIDLFDKRTGALLDKRIIKTGFRQLGNAQSELSINGRRLFLRGTLECSVFPLKGYPPMDERSWIEVFKIARSYGLNHFRFHSWCPPEAAFRAADSLGFYLHVELPLWSLQVGKDKPTLNYLAGEAQQIIRNYGNHPSFCFWSMGNELEGDFSWLNQLVTQLKKQDDRRLYTSSTFSFQQGHGLSPEPVADYFITQYTKKGWVRGQGIFNTSPPDFETDYSKSTDGIKVPLIIHEMGQYSVYPDLSEIKNYTGNLDPLNFKAVRYDLAKKNMTYLAKQFTIASGKLAVNLYKEEIERALKTPNVSGFQLLDLHDFPGQGTALVGVLNAFWQSKGLIAPSAFRDFCSPIVPLLRFAKATYTNNEQFNAIAQLANFSGGPINVKPEWRIINDKGETLYKGILGQSTVAVGNRDTLGRIEVRLSAIKNATRLRVILTIPSLKLQNQWNVWVYPASLPDADKQVVFTTSVKDAITWLGKGKNVILNPDTASIQGVSGRFAPVFWSPVHFPDQPGTMGLLVDVRHPALKDFPTDFYSDWQWWDLVTRSKTMITDSLQGTPHPIVRVIDNFFKNRNMADVLEFKVGNGKLILCSMDIHSNLEERPTARQLRYSFLNYAASKLFNPGQEIDEHTLLKFFK